MAKHILKNKNYIKYLILLLATTVLNAVFVDFIAIKEYTPDLFIILVVWIALKEGRFIGVIAGFLIGLFVDVTSLEVIGLNALSKTIVAFIASYFYKANTNEQIIRSYKFILIVLLSTLVHNAVYLLMLIRTSQQHFILMYVWYGLATTAYTTFCSIFVVLFQLSYNRMKTRIYR